jgi:Tfp pilus assembly protein PilX
MKDQKGQVLLVVFMMLLLVGTLVAGTSVIWQSGVSNADSSREALRAFYIAQAGIERARAEIAVNGNNGYAPTFSNVAFGGGKYTAVVSRPGGSNTLKDITSTGMFSNCTRTIKMRVTRNGGSWPGNPLLTRDYWQEQ